MTKQIIKYGIIGLFTLFVGCKSSRSYYTEKGELKNISDAKLVSATQDNYLQYKQLFFKKFSADISINGESNSFKGNMYIDGNKEIVVSVLPLMGIELMRVRFSPDSIEIMDRTKRSYTVGSYKSLWDKFLVELDFEALHSILTNELFLYPLSSNFNEDIKKYKHYIVGDNYSLKSIKNGRFERKYRREDLDELVLHDFTILPEAFKISKTTIHDVSNASKVTVSYSDFFKINDQLFPRTLIIDGQKDAKKYVIKITFDSVDVDSENKIGFKISDKYDLIKY